MQFQYSNKVDDYVTFAKLIQKRKGKISSIEKILFYSYFIISVIISIFYFKSLNNISVNEVVKCVAIVCICFFSWIVLFPQLIKIVSIASVRISVKIKPRLLETKYIELKDKKILIKDNKDKFIYELNINEIIEVIKVKETLYIFDNNTAIIISLIELQEDIKECFFNYLKEYIKIKTEKF